MNSRVTLPPELEGLGDFIGKLDPTALLVALLSLIFQHHASTNPPAPAPPAPPVVPPAPPAPAPVAPPAPSGSIADRMPVHQIIDGKANVTGIVDMTVPRVQTRLADDLVDLICAGTARAPRDIRVETDCSPMADDGYVFGADDPRWVTDPQPGSVDDPEAQPMRLLGEMSAGLTGGVRHVDQNFGCDCWWRAAGTGEIRNLRYVGPSYQGGPHAEITLKRKGQPVSVIHVG
jgi:hypothetical protein